MISNNTSYKLKASKSSREIHDFDNNQSDDNYENSSVDGEVEGNQKYHAYSRDNRFRNAGRPRSSEFRSSRGERRSGFRGRAPAASRRGERDTSDNYYILSRKYQDSRHLETGSHHGKFYVPEKKNDLTLNLPEDTRISKLLRRLSTETDQENSLTISKKLLEVLLLPDNSQYVRKAFHILGDSMYEILQVSPGPLAKQQAARALGRMGYIMGQENDFDRYQNWLFGKLKNSPEEMQMLLVKTFKETLAFEREKPVLQDRAEHLMHHLVGLIEVTENAEVFKAILDALMTVVEIYPDYFYAQFQDTVDLLFGWHVDHSQPLCNIEFVSRSLQRISTHFKYNLEFAVSLIENFLEDIATYGNQLNDSDSNSFDHVTVLILALNTVLKCLGESFKPSNNKHVSTDLITTCLNQVIKTSKEALENFVPDNLIIATNDSVGILLSHLDTKPQSLSSLIYELIDVEMSLIHEFSDSTIVSMLLLISKIIKELSANLPIELIEKLIGPKSDIVKLRYSHFKNIQHSVICVYQALLNLKNVSLLQEAFRYVLGDLEAVYMQIVPGIKPFIPNNPFNADSFKLNEETKELTVLFLLRCLSQLANASSIIVMWALKPTILELVGTYLEPFNESLASNMPALQYSLLFLLYSHCKCYNHFISSSNLVAKNQEQPNLIGMFSERLNVNDVPETSPNLGNFEIILDILYKTLRIETSSEVTLLLLQWLSDILINSDSYLSNLYDNEKFVALTEVLVKCGYDFNENVVLVVCENLDKLLTNKHLPWSNKFLVDVCDLCKLHLNSNKPEIRRGYSTLSSNIPWDVAVIEFNKSHAVYDAVKTNADCGNYNNYAVWVAQHMHVNTIGDIYPLQFKLFMDYLLKNETDGSTHWLEDMFVSSWPLQGKLMDFYNVAMNSRSLLNSWATLESAQFCVNSKLRTPLGKPNETFTKIESALNQLGNDLVSKKNESNGSNRVRLLLEFVENLEKAIYNASEGCAMAMQQPPKQVRSFFITNTNTCSEWLSRIRMVVVHIAMHAGDSCTAIRHGQALLHDLVATSKSGGIEFERVLIFVTLAYLQMRETEALLGLYLWCKNSTGRKFLFVKYAAEQASKRYEIAIEGYKKCLKNEPNLEADSKHFIYDQIAICYKELGNWIDLTNWNAEENRSGSGDNGRRYWFSLTDWKCVDNLFNIEVGRESFSDLSSWNYKEQCDSWSQYEEFTATETNLYSIAFCTSNRNDLEDKVEANLSRIQESIQNNLNLAPSEFLQNMIVMHYTSCGVKTLLNGNASGPVFLVSEDFENEITKIDSSILRKVLWWSEYFDGFQNLGTTTFSNNLRLEVVKRARKEKNFKMALSHLIKFLRSKDMSIDNYTNMSEVFLDKITNVSLWSVEIARAVSEVIKLSYATEDNRHNTFNLCAAASTAISKFAEINGSVEAKKISSKILLKLAGWLQVNEDINLTEINSALGKFLMVLPEIGMVEVATSVIPMNEMAIGKLLQFSVHQCAGLAKSWNIFGTWCYRWGRKIVDHSSDIQNNLTEEDCSTIKDLLPADVNPDDLNQIFTILSKTRSNLDEEDIESNDVNTSEMIQNQLRYIKALRNSPEKDLLTLVQIWRNTQKRVYAYYALSAEAYFKYLHLTLNSENVTSSTECNIITVTLRLLRLIVKYALELQNILEEGLQTTPTQPWKVIIPQLFSRLNHPESYVRHRVADLLCRIAEDAPHLITFPAVVGALEGGLKFDFSEISLPKDCLSQNNECHDELNEEDDNYDSDNEYSSNALQTCFKTMVDTLSKQDPETIAQVQSLVKELRRITLLWDELWLGTLAQHQSEISKRQQQLEYEIEKVNENPNLDKEEKLSLITEKHRIIIKPIVFVLEQLQEITSVEPETPHEKQFQEKYLEEISGVINKLKNPEQPDKPQESLQPLKLLQKQFQQKFHRRASYALKMQSISPVLASIRNTLIAMPGLTTTSRVTISHVSNIVSILPTKTKPKKLMFYGSDGQTYTYLFKGLEDLHLDERIMQFLSIANNMMAQNADLTGHNLYRARHYSVIPLGPRSGLISWVDRTTPVFALYKRWQQRENVKPNTKNSLNAVGGVLRPSELFYNKLNPLLKEHGIKNIENRKEWPLSTLKQVLVELMAETPSDLLAKELWCNSISASAWWQVVKRYSYSIAVMSIIGYIIGLGDRHLDNVLVDLTSGEVVHIDYNVCFEKGKTLRVPEKVPFRLTPNIKGALGVTGVEGIFRMVCENVLKTMRRGRETLLTLLEAFVYDPLIDWTVGGEVLAGTSFGGITTTTTTKQSKKELEREVTSSMFNVRCTEMRVEWGEKKDEILRDIPDLIQHINNWSKTHLQITYTEDQLQDLHQQMALVKEAEAHGANKHNLYSLPSRYEVYCKTQDAMRTAKKDVDKIIAESENHMTSYFTAVKLLESAQFAQWLVDIKATTTDMNVFDLVKEFLHNAGKNDVITQCEQSETEVAQLSQIQSHHILRCLQLLQEYSAIITQCPRSYLENHRICMFLRWCKYMLEHRTVQGCDLIFDKFKVFHDVSNAKHIVQLSYNLDAFYKETVGQVNKLYEDLTKIRSQESGATLEKLYANARLGVSNFLNSEKATNAFEFVIVNELVLLNKTFLTLETAANRSGDLLIKLTSRDGDWFLDDLVLNSTRVVEMINNLPVKHDEDGQFTKVLNGIRICNNIYKGLQELHFNFHTIILPESMKKIQSEEATVVQMVGEIGALIMGLGTSIPEMILQLEKILSCLFMQMEINPSCEAFLERVASVRIKFLSLLRSQSDVLSPGKMLLMGFNGLFKKLNQEMYNLVTTLGDLNVPASWKKLDQVKEAKSISAHIFNPKVHEILEDIFLLKRLQTMSDFFGLTLEMCQSIEGNGKCVLFNDEQLVKPVRQFIADYISRQLLGITTEAVAYSVCYLLQHLTLDVTHEIEQKDIGAESKVPLDELCHKAWNYLLKKGVFTQNLISQASSFSTNLKTAWEKIQEPKKIELKLAVLQSSALRIQNQLTVYNFMHEEVLNQLHGQVYTAIRSKFIMDLRHEMNNLNTVHVNLIEAKEKQQSLIENAYQRLNWAKGANPNVIEISAAFETAVSARDTRFNLEKTIGSEVLNACKVILQHEVLRTPSNEAKSFDKMFLNSFEKWRIACQYSSRKTEAMTPTEESIMNLLNNELAHNPKWLEVVSEIISDQIVINQKTLEEDKLLLFSTTEKLGSKLDVFKELYNAHCRLMGDVKSLIKSMTKIEEYSSQTQQFITEYREYIDNFSSVFSKFKKNPSIEDINACLGHLEFVERHTKNIYESLLNLEVKRNRAQLIRQDCVAASPMRVVQKQESTTKGQQRNAYAVGVWRRVKMKLEGRDPDPGRKYTPQEQVDFVIREATNLDNLALLYEGWTPWV